ncbi:hypothetical protein RHRU231_50012 [Rhodococcus ruber]|uniref:Uncharacterized protein n=1 Tax=Rhodococcus ruber TaxID=1830 RepID=A0A098BMZ4_9NOCA|nr:hypothetical protein RHRU231_50012 [Rhodococcus ruber]
MHNSTDNCATIGPGGRAGRPTGSRSTSGCGGGGNASSPFMSRPWHVRAPNGATWTQTGWGARRSGICLGAVDPEHPLSAGRRARSASHRRRARPDDGHHAPAGPVEQGQHGCGASRCAPTTVGLWTVPEFDPPAPWAHAVTAVGRDLRCLRYGRYIGADRLVGDCRSTASTTCRPAALDGTGPTTVDGHENLDRTRTGK